MTTPFKRVVLGGLLRSFTLSALLSGSCALLGVLGPTPLVGATVSSAHAAPHKNLRVSVDVISAQPLSSSRAQQKNAQTRTKMKTTRRVDAQLRSARTTLLKSFPRLDDFKLLSRDRLSLREGGSSAQVKIERELNASLSLVSYEGSHVSVRVRVPQKNVELNVKARRGELFFQAMRWRGRVYLLAIKAH